MWKNNLLTFLLVKKVIVVVVVTSPRVSSCIGEPVSWSSQIALLSRLFAVG